MKQTAIKYFYVTLMLFLFLLKGLTTVLPIFSCYLHNDEWQEMKMNSQSENTEENNNEKRIDTKEFLGYFYNDPFSAIQYAYLSKSSPAREFQFKKSICLPVNTPPPKNV